MTTNTMTFSLKDLAGWFKAHRDDLYACDPDLNEDSQSRYFGLQREEQELEAAIQAAGFTWEQVEMAADTGNA